MSDPNIDPDIDFDQLLSDHLDGCLAEGDLQTLNAELERNASLRNQHERLLTDQKNLREMFRQSSTMESGSTSSSQVGLPSDFASKVVAEATRRRAAQRSVVVASSEQSAGIKRRTIAGIIATAAAVLLLATLATRNWSGAEIAQNETQSLVGPVDLAESQDSSQARDTTERVENLPVENLPAEDSRDPRMHGPQLAADASPQPSTNATEIQPEVVPMDRIARTVPARSVPARKSNDVGMPLDQSAAVSVQRQQDDSMSGAVLVYDVRLTTQGRVTQCVAKTMNQVGMPETSRQPIDGELVNAAKSVDSFDEDSKFQLLYLRAPAKQLDRLFKSLLRDRDNVSSLGLALVTDSPILKVTDNLRSVDSTLVQHAPGTASFELASDDAGELAVLRRLLDDQTFLPMMPETTGLNPMNPELPSGSGTDVMTRVLLIVR